MFCLKKESGDVKLKHSFTVNHDNVSADSSINQNVNVLFQLGITTSEYSSNSFNNLQVSETHIDFSPVTILKCDTDCSDMTTSTKEFMSLLMG